MICPNCQKENDEGANFCKGCGRRLIPPPVTRSYEVTDNSQSVRADSIGNLILGSQPTVQVEKCPICGKNNPSDKTFLCQCCQRDSLCVDHQDSESFLCDRCERQHRRQRKLHEAEQKKLRAGLEAELRQEIEVEIEDGVRRQLEPRLQREIEARLKPELEARVRQELEPRLRAEIETSLRQEMAGKQKTSPPAPSPKQGFGEGKEKTGERLSIQLGEGVEMEFVRIPAGEFLMGSTDADKEAQPHEKPQHKVHLDEYWIGKYPVTNLQYQAFVLAQKRAAPGHWNDEEIPDGYEDHPVVNVNWQDAAAFCDWVRKVIRQKGGMMLARLPTEAEWEKAARGPDGRLYPWGSQPPDQARCNFNIIVGDTTPVGEYSPQGDSPYGCADISGNVWEWVADWYDEAYYGRLPASNPPGPTSGQLRVLRGGSWCTSSDYVRAAYRYGGDPTSVGYSVGFRCAASPGK